MTVYSIGLAYINVCLCNKCICQDFFYVLSWIFINEGSINLN